MKYRIQAVCAAIAIATAPVAISAFPIGNSTAPMTNSAAADTNTVRQDNTGTPPAAAGNTSVAANGQDATSPRQGGSAGNNDSNVPIPLSLLLQLFVLAVVLESALAVLFQWRPYLANIDGKAVNPLLTFIAALILVWHFKLDGFGQLIHSYNANDPTMSWSTSIITALVIAGGSAGVNRMLRTVGYRPVSVEQDQPKPPPTEGWIAVIDARPPAAQDYDVLVRTGGGVWAVVGSIARRARLGGIFRWMLRDHRRFPTSGGLPVPLGVNVEVAVQNRSPGSVPTTIWGPNAVGAGAIIDIQVT